MLLQLGGGSSSIGAGRTGVQGVHSAHGGRPTAGLSSINGGSSAHVFTIHLSNNKSLLRQFESAFILGDGQPAMLARGVFVGTVYYL